MLGAIARDIIGSVYESRNIKTTQFPLFQPRCRPTDDSVLTIAVASVLLDGADYIDRFHDYFHQYPRAGYGLSFHRWARTRQREPYFSFGNGAAMRVSPVGWAFDSEAEVLAEAERCAGVTHNHPEGIKGAQATALAILLGRQGADKGQIREQTVARFGYELGFSLDAIRPNYRFDVTCQGTVPVALVAFLESADYESGVRNAISVGGDSDTLSCITGSIAEAFYGGVPAEIAETALTWLDGPQRKVTEQFRAKYCCP
jgi:ADP-ribosylglycohydrolase